MKTFTILAIAIFSLLSTTGRAEAEQLIHGCFVGSRMVTTEHTDLNDPAHKEPPVDGSPCQNGGVWQLLFKGSMKLNLNTIQGVRRILATDLPKFDAKGMTVQPWTRNPDWDGKHADKMTKSEVNDLWDKLVAECKAAYPSKPGFNTQHDAEIVHQARLVFRPPQNLSQEQQDAYVADHAAFLKAVAYAETGLNNNQDTCELSGPKAGGFIQVIAETSFEHCSGVNLLIPKFGIQCGAKEIARYATLNKVGGSLGLVMAAYNMGYGALQKNGMTPYTRTIAYTKKILAAWAWFRENGLASKPNIK